MKTSSAKAKGRRLQQWTRDQILETFEHLEPDDVRSTGMGQGGMDVQLSPAAQRVFPFGIECKNVEKLNVWDAFGQAEANCGKLEALLIIKRNGKAPLAIVDAEWFFENAAHFKTTKEKS